jgi:hypothetical protein
MDMFLKLFECTINLSACFNKSIYEPLPFTSYNYISIVHLCGHALCAFE